MWQIIHMKNPSLVLYDKIIKTLKDRKISVRRAQNDAGLKQDFIRDLKRFPNRPVKTESLLKLAKYLNISIEYFLEALDASFQKKTKVQSHLIPVPITEVYICGEVQAGKWREAIQWNKQDWIPLSIPTPIKYKNFHRYALYVRGDSMNLLFPDGTIVIVINFCDLGSTPESGDCVVTIRRDNLTDSFEATLKIVQIRKDGRIFLWPRSNNPDFVKPIALPQITKKNQYNDMDGDCSATPDIFIQGLVIGSFNILEKIEIK